MKLEAINVGGVDQGATMYRVQLLPWAGLLLGMCLGEAAPAATLVQEGKARAVILLPADADETEKLAARELIDHVEKMSGARLPTVSMDAKNLERFLVEARR